MTGPERAEIIPKPNGYHQPSTSPLEQPANPCPLSAASAVDQVANENGCNSSEPEVSMVSPANQTTPDIGKKLAAAKHRNRSSSFPLRGIRPPPIETPHASRRITSVNSPEARAAARNDVMKLSPAQIYNLTSAPDSLPVRPITPRSQTQISQSGESEPRDEVSASSGRESSKNVARGLASIGLRNDAEIGDPGPAISERLEENTESHNPSPLVTSQKIHQIRPTSLSRSMSIPPTTQAKNSQSFRVKDRRGAAPAYAKSRFPSGPQSARLQSLKNPDSPQDIPSSPRQSSMPLPPFSMPTYLQLELSTDRPSPLYIYRTSSTDIPYESSRIKFERLLNFLMLPPELEQALLFGAMTCLDAWLYEFTILPLRFLKALWIFLLWVGNNVLREVDELSAFVRSGVRRLWHRHRRRSSADRASSATKADPPPSSSSPTPGNHSIHPKNSDQPPLWRTHRRSRSTPSALEQNHKADILQGLLIIFSSIVLTKLDASRMYHSIRGQAAIKLYVIYNVLEVFDKLFSALGQDILECLFSRETLERDSNGRSKVIRPFWMFLLALVYTVIHAAALFYQVITLNVAVNSYSNALLTLLMSNQFVEIKGTVFKKIEKENLFQMTCADVVERFQLWIMLLIIALRNLIEVGGLSINLGSSKFAGPSSSGSAAFPPNATAAEPLASPLSILPNAFAMMPRLLPLQVLGPYLLVLGSEMLVDWLKHAYITKFNATSSRIYGRFFDILAKDYYSHAFSTQSLTRRLGLPVIPLACLFIRAALQTYHMFLATNISPPSVSATTSLSVESDDPTSSPVLVQIEQIFRRALGQSSFGGGSNGNGSSKFSNWSWSLDDVIALATMIIFFLLLYLLLLALKLALGMILLGVARRRYRGMRAREQDKVVETGTRRFGGWGAVEVGDERRKWIYADDPDGLKGLRERDIKAREREETGRASANTALDKVDRYSMVAKRIW